MTHSEYLVWFRRDLRAHDHAALHHALKLASETGGSVTCAFVFDTDILASLPAYDRRVDFIWHSLVDLDGQLQALSAGAARLLVLHGNAGQLIPKLCSELGVRHLFFNHDDEPQSLLRDALVTQALTDISVAVHSFKDHVIFERREILTQMSKPYTVFTPYKNAWLKLLASSDAKTAPHPIEPHAKALAIVSKDLQARYAIPSLVTMGFQSTQLEQHHIHPGSTGAAKLLQDFLPRMHRYQEARDYPSVKGPSYLSVHLRFGTISIRQLVSLAYSDSLHGSAAGSAGAATWLSELIWRDFYNQIMANFPHAMHGCFKPEYNNIVWEQGAHADALFKAWCEAQTGYPLVDAAMRQLNQTGYMHNRLRMMVASFLTKDLGLDWRWGADYFAQHLIDFDLSANNGGWQWAASSGCDAQPYFRIFNPTTQSQKFDPEGKFIRRYMPELAHLDNKAIHTPRSPVVDHSLARDKTLQRYSVVKTATGQPAKA